MEPENQLATQVSQGFLGLLKVTQGSLKFPFTWVYGWKGHSSRIQCRVALPLREGARLCEIVGVLVMRWWLPPSVACG